MEKNDPQKLAALKRRADESSVDIEMLKQRLCAPTPPSEMIVTLDDLSVDFSRQTISLQDWTQLIDFGQSVLTKRDALLNGATVNTSENRPALHTHLRTPHEKIAQKNLKAMTAMTQTILDMGIDAKGSIDDVVVLGIGGSYLGPKMVAQALAPFHQPSHKAPQIHFVSNIDPADLDDTLALLNPRTTAVIAISKTFTTTETLMNLEAAWDWLKKGGLAPEARTIAVTAHTSTAEQTGIKTKHILTMHEGVGGRFSLWSAVGLPIMLATGEAVFTQLLAGAHQMDRHFATAPPHENIPIIGGLMRLWNRSLLGQSGLAVIPYDQRLSLLPSWLQQLEMESNGKTLMADGRPQAYGTAPIVFGDAGSNVQHSFFQMIHQSADIVPVDFLAPLTPTTLAGDASPEVLLRHRTLIAQMLAQADCLAMGGDNINHFSGGRPSTIITWHKTNAFALGRILALYEHITAVSGWLLGLNSFDQPGVELGKKIAKKYQTFMDKGGNGHQIPTTSKQIMQKIAK